MTDKNEMPIEIWALHLGLDDATWYEVPVSNTTQYTRTDHIQAQLDSVIDMMDKILDLEIRWDEGVSDNFNILQNEIILCQDKLKEMRGNG